MARQQLRATGFAALERPAMWAKALGTSVFRDWKDCQLTLIAVTGASGNVGRAIVPLLIHAGFEPLLFGRDLVKLQSLFPREAAYGNSEFGTRIKGCQAVIHLATINNDNDKTSTDEFQRVNVMWPIWLARQARDAGVTRFIFLSSTHAIDVANRSPYAITKRNATQALRQITGIHVSEIVAPKVYDDRGSRPMCWLWRTLGAFKPTVSSSQLTNVIAEEIAEKGHSGRARLVSKEMSRPRSYAAFTATIDISFALGVLLCFGWLLLLVGLAVRIDSPGPALFRQVRVGKKKNEFVCWKFRTMHVGSAHRATHEMTSSSITRVGAFLRRTKLDELPQVLNLLRRELALVGPRPCLPTQTELIDERDRLGVYSVRPGITGYAQINDLDMSRPFELARWDECYCALRSISFDLKILLKTFVGGGRGDRVRAS